MQYFKKNINLFIVIVLFIILCVSYILIIPVFEAPDENWHFMYAFYISKYNRIASVYKESIPVKQYIKEHTNEDQDPTIFMDEKYMFYKTIGGTYRIHNSLWHPPLYYLIASQIIKPFRVDSIDMEYNYEYPNNPNNPGIFQNNKILKDSNPTYSLVLILRLFGVICGAIVLLFIYKIINLLSNGKFENRSVFLLSGIAFLPQFIFLCSYVNNDIFSALLGLISIYFIILLFKKDKSYLGFVSILFAILASASKYTMLLMIPLTIIAFFIWLIIKKKVWAVLSILLVIFLTFCAFYYIINFQKIAYSKSIIGVSLSSRINISNIAGIIKEIVNKRPLINTASLSHTFKSSVAVFGWGDGFAGKFIYNFFFAYIVSGVLLFFVNIRGYREDRKSIIFILASIISIFAYFILYAIYTNWVQNAGRVIILAVFLTFILAMLGFKSIKAKYSNILYYGLFANSLFISVFCLYNYIYLKYY